LRGIIATLGGFIIARSIINTADSFRLMQNRLETLTGSTAAATVEFNKLFDVAQRTRSDFLATGETFARLAIAYETTGLTIDQTRTLVEGLNAGLINNGVSTTEAAGAIRQLSQAFAAGKLAGDELRSVLENLGPIGRNIANELGFKGTNAIGEFADAARNSRLSIEQIAAAMHNALLPQITRLNNTVPTVGQKFTQLRNDMQRVTAEAFNGEGASAGLVEVMEELRQVVGSEGFKTGLVAISQAIALIASEAAKTVERLGDLVDAISNLDFEAAGRAIFQNSAPGMLFEGTIGRLLPDKARTPQTSATVPLNLPPKRLPIPEGTSVDKEAVKKATTAREGIRRMIQALQDETKTIGLNQLEREKLTAILKAEEIARRGNIQLTESQRTAIEGEITAQQTLAAIKSRSDVVRAAQQELEVMQALGRTKERLEAQQKIENEEIQTGIKFTQEQKDAILEQVDARYALIQAHETDSILQSLRDETAALQVQGAARARLLQQQQLEAQERSGGIHLTEEQKNRILDETEAHFHLREELERQNELYDELGNAAGNFFETLITDAGSALQALRGLALELSKIGLQTFATGPLQSFVTGQASGLFSGGSISGSSSPSPTAVQVAHRGGTAGSRTHSRMVSPALFAGAPRMHDGGIAGLRPNEIPAILERGEKVTPAGQSSGLVAIHLHGVTDAGSFMRSSSKIRSELARAVRLGSSRDI
jgi:tape measure domain-containing protein